MGIRRFLKGHGKRTCTGARDGPDDGHSPHIGESRPAMQTRELLQRWLDLSDAPREQRRFLEAHPQLLAPSSDALLDARVAEAEQSGAWAQAYALRDAQALLRDATRRGGDSGAICDAYVNSRGGLALDVPSWLEAVEARVAELSQQGLPHETASARAMEWGGELAQAGQTPHLEPAISAELRLRRWQALYEGIELLDPADLGALDVGELDALLGTFTRERYPRRWASVQHLRGVWLQGTLQTLTAARLEQAIDALLQALTVRDEHAFPLEWAESQRALGRALSNAVAGPRDQRREEAIERLQAALTVFTRERFPKEWANTQTDLGTAYKQRASARQAENIESAIGCYEAALQVTTFEADPLEWAKAINNLGIAYKDRIRGDRAENLERAISCHLASLRVRSRERFPSAWAQTQHNLGLAYLRRVLGDPADNQERAIAHQEAALAVRTRESNPIGWARTMGNLAGSYYERLRGDRAENLERTLGLQMAALEVFTYERTPADWSQIHLNIGNTYLERISGSRVENIERAIEHLRLAIGEDERGHYSFGRGRALHNLGEAYARRGVGDPDENYHQALACYEQALEVLTREARPYEWAYALCGLGQTHTLPQIGERHERLCQAERCFQRALEVLTPDAYPYEHHRNGLRLARVKAELGEWEAAHAAYASASRAEDFMLALGVGVVNRDAVLKESTGAAGEHGFVLTRLGHLEEAAVALEAGLARSLAEGRAFSMAAPERIQDPERRARYEHARRRLIVAQAALHGPSEAGQSEVERRATDIAHVEALQQARSDFNRVVAAVRAARDPADLLYEEVTAETLLRAAHRGGTSHALVYLVATPWGGVAVAARSAEQSWERSGPGGQGSARFAALDLPELTDAFVAALSGIELGVELGVELGAGLDRVVGGFAPAQQGAALSLLSAWPGATLREQAGALHEACVAANAQGTLDAAAQELLARPEFADDIDTPLEDLSATQRSFLDATLGHRMLHLELTRCLDALARVVAGPLVEWLGEQEITSVTLVPCGELATFPLACVPLDDERTFGEALPASVAPSARALLSGGAPVRPRAGLYAVGDTRPRDLPLPWSEAEALTMAALARGVGLASQVKVKDGGTRDWLLSALRQGEVVNIACHGRFDAHDYLRSRLLLGRDEELTLADMLAYNADLSGLRLLVVSACQAANLDLRGARDEVHSLTAGMIQAGADAVLSPWWMVDDRASFLLMARFAQEWLPKMATVPPAAALARAQRWLRTATNRDLGEWEARIANTPSAATAVAERDGSDGTSREGAAGSAGRASPVVAVRGRGLRLDIDDAARRIREQAAWDDPDTRPYADPYYWAGFQVTGW